MSFEKPKSPNQPEITKPTVDTVAPEVTPEHSIEVTSHNVIEPSAAEVPQQPSEQIDLPQNGQPTEQPTPVEIPALEGPPMRERTPALDYEAINRSYQRPQLFSPAVLERLKSAPETVRHAATKAYEGLSSVPLVAHAMGRVEMSLSQRWLERHENKALHLKGKFDRHDAEFKTLEQSQKEIEVQMRELVAAGIPGTDSLQVFLQKIDKQKNTALQKREAAEIKINERKEKISNYTEKRDRIADRFIAELDEKLEPHQERMRHLDAAKAACDSEISSAKARHDQELSILKELSEKKKGIVSTLLKAGMSQRQIDANTAVVNIDKHITEGRNRVRFEMEKLDAKQAKVRYQTAHVKKKSSPYEQKRAALERIKNGRRVQINLPTTETVVAQNGPTEPEDEIVPSTPVAANENTPESNQNELAPNQLPNLESFQEIRLREAPTKYLQACNQHLQRTFPQAFAELQIKPDEFFRITKIKPHTKLSGRNFIKLVNVYYMTKEEISINQRGKVMHTINLSSLSRNLSA